MTDLDAAHDMLERAEKRWEDLRNRYSRNATPSWVSTDLCLISEDIKFYKKQIERLSRET